MQVLAPPPVPSSSPRWAARRCAAWRPAARRTAPQWRVRSSARTCGGASIMTREQRCAASGSCRAPSPMPAVGHEVVARQCRGVTCPTSIRPSGSGRSWCSTAGTARGPAATRGRGCLAPGGPTWPRHRTGTAPTWRRQRVYGRKANGGGDSGLLGQRGAGEARGGDGTRRTDAELLPR